MNYRRPFFPWIIAACFFGMAVVLAVLALQGIGPGDGVVLGVGTVAEVIFGIGVIVMKLRYGSG